MMAARKALIAGLLLASLIPFAGGAWAYSTGRFTTGETGGSFPGENNCSRCHTGSDLNSGSGTVSLTVGGSAPSEVSYTPGETVSLIISFTDANASRSGFQLAVRSGDGCDQAGTLVAGTTDAGANVKVVDGTCNTSAVNWATHTQPTNGTSASWDISWTAPAESVGTVTIAFSVNGANGDRARTGDKIYTYSTTIEPAAVGTPAPVISDNGVTLADKVSATTSGSPNALATAVGTDFTEATGPVSGKLDDDGQISTNLVGTCVEVGTTRAPILQLAPEEVTFQIPSGTGIGSTTVKVIRGCDEDGAMSSNSAAFTIAAVKPVFFQFSESPAGIAALHTDLTLVAEVDAVTGRVTRPAKPGEDFVTFFGTGFGKTDPPLGTGEIATQPRVLDTTDLKLMIGQTEVAADNIFYAGAAPDYAGLYQLSFLVPDTVAAGEHAFSVMLDGVSSPAGPKLWIAEPADTSPTACTVGLEVASDETCEVMVGADTLSFSINDSGQGCITKGTEDPTCGDTTVSLDGLEAARETDGPWTISAVPAAPESEEDEIQTCAVELTLNPGESCQYTITVAGATTEIVLDVDDEGEVCVTTSGGTNLCGATLLALFPAFGAEIEEDEADNSWTIKKLPPLPEDESDDG